MIPSHRPKTNNDNKKNDTSSSSSRSRVNNDDYDMKRSLSRTRHSNDDGNYDDDDDDDDDAKQQPLDSLPSSFYCPICLTSYDIPSRATTAPTVSAAAAETPITATTSTTANRSPTTTDKEENESDDDDDDYYTPPNSSSPSPSPSHHDDDFEKNNNNNNNTIIERHFQLSTCRHIMCGECLYMHCASKINDGRTMIRCCYPVSSGGVEEDDGEESSSFRSCHVPLGDDDVRRLLRLYGRSRVSKGMAVGDACGGGEGGVSEFVLNPGIIKNGCEDEEVDVPEGEEESEEEGMILLRKFEKFKFDALHGNALRRCPKCDHPKIFKMVEKKRKVMNPLPPPPPPSFSAEQNNINNIGICIPLPDTINDNNNDDDEIIFEFEEPTPSPPPSSSHTPPLLHPTNPIVTCTNCTTTFCYYHSNAHPPTTTCSEYEAEISHIMQQSEDYFRVNVKSCPRCAAHVQKAGGCNQMLCPNCGIHFCWLCLREVDGGTFPSHYQWWNLGGCPNMQLNEKINPPRHVLLFMKGLAMLQICFIGIPSVVLAVGSSLLCCCCVFGMGRNVKERMTQCVSFWGNFLTVVMLLPFILVGGLISLLLFLFVNCVMSLTKAVANVKQVLRKRQQRQAEETGEETMMKKREGKTVEMTTMTTGERGRHDDDDDDQNYNKPSSMRSTQESSDDSKGSGSGGYSEFNINPEIVTRTKFDIQLGKMEEGLSSS